jgi:hypothetical protein
MILRQPPRRRRPSPEALVLAHLVAAEAARLSVFPPAALGHHTVNPTPYLQGLYQLIPADLLQNILQRTGHASQRQRRLPAPAVTWLVIAMALFPHLSIPNVWRQLHPSSPRAEPADSAFTQARQRLGVAPLRHLFTEVAQLLATPQTRGAFYRGRRLMAWDGTTLDLPDTPDNERIFGRPGNDRCPGAFPQVRLLALCELGTHAICGLQIKPLRCGEVSMAPTLLRHLQPDMLLLWDRLFLSFDLVQSVRARGAHLLARVKNDLILKEFEQLPDGSYKSKIYPTPGDREQDRNGLGVRVIGYTHDDAGRPGQGELHRLLTTLLDPAELPAREAPGVYHERWEIELAFDEIKTHLNGRAVEIRSKTPAGVVQEIYGLVLAHYVLRRVMHDAACQRKLDPDRLSFTNTLSVLRSRLHEALGQSAAAWYKGLVGEVQRQELRPRRQRWYARVVKKVQADFPKKRAEHRKPRQPTKRFDEAVVLLGPEERTPARQRGSG